MPKRELERLQAVHQFLGLKTNKERELQEIVELASALCKTPVALITLIDKDTQYFKFRVGTDVEQSARKNSFCQYLIDKEELLVIPDALLDIRFADIPILTSHPKIRFYAGAPLNTYDGHTLGSLCILDTKPKRLTNNQKKLLNVLGKRIVQIMEFEFVVGILKRQFMDAKDAEIKLRSFFESGGACHMLIGMDLEILAFNKNMAEFIERMYQLQIHIGLEVKDILKDKPLESFVADYNTALSGTPVKFEREYQYQDEETIWLYVTFEAGYDPAGEIIGISYNATDITERKLQEQQILEQNEALRKIAYIESHELRKPVASILGFMELFKLDDYTSSREDLVMMGKAAEELDTKIRDIVKITTANEN
jgi:PAS domain S-box-containing protein